jgi:hypothetical protein
MFSYEPLSCDVVDGYTRLTIEGYCNYLPFYQYTTYHHYYLEEL